MDPTILQTLMDGEMIPVIAPLGAGRNGETWNVNGDTAAGAIAASLDADRLLLLTDVSGVKNDEGEVLTELTPDQIRQLTKDGVIAGGMLPKVQCALDALAGGVSSAQIIDGRVPHALLLEVFTDTGVGTQITGFNDSGAVA